MKQGHAFDFETSHDLVSHHKEMPFQSIVDNLEHFCGSISLHPSGGADKYCYWPERIIHSSCRIFEYEAILFVCLLRRNMYGSEIYS